MDDMFVHEYVGLAGRLNQELGRLTRDYCATECHRGPAGCCTVQGFLQGTVPLLSRMQAAEAENNGWEHTPSGCQYHNPEYGCALDKTKTPLCLGALCDPLEDHLKETYGEQANAFIKAMYTLEGRSLAREHPMVVLHAMHTALEKAQQMFILS